MDDIQIKLIEAFAYILERKPFDCIKPAEVAEVAGVEESVFAFHFKDIYEAADALLREESDAVATSGIKPETGGEAFLLSASFVLRFPESAKHLCLSSGGGIYKKYVSSLAGKCFSEVVLAKLGDKTPGERERCAVKFLRAAATGLASRELVAAKDPRAAAEQYTDFFDEITDKL